MLNSLAITGPTASGKTSISIDIAKNIGAEIISCDSMQIYKDMNIGTAKATADEQKEVRHHLIDFLSPREVFSQQSYREMAISAAKKIHEAGKIALFVGGTGLYIDALTRAPMNDVPESSKEYRDALLSEIKTDDDIDRLWNRLKEIDPESAEKIHKKNLRRVIRAIEIFESTGKTKSYFDRMSQNFDAEISVNMITLDFHNRENLYKRVDLRVDMMMNSGLLSEVEDLYNRGLLAAGTTAAQAIGYKELIMFLEGELTLGEAVELIKLSSRRYAKRQLTWFRHVNGAARVYLDDESGIMRDMSSVVQEALEISKNYIEGFSNETD